MYFKLLLLLLFVIFGGFLLFSQKTLPLVKPNFNQVLFIPVTPAIEQIFSQSHSLPTTLPQEKLRTIIATGDIILARSVNFQTVIRKDFKWPYLKTANILSNADITFINLETPLINPCPITQEGMIFCGDQRHLEGLIYAGVDIASLANNHAGNYGAEGVRKTYDLLTKNRVLAVGVNGPMIKEVKGLKFAFLGYNDVTKPQPGISNVDEQNLKSEIIEAKNMADVVIVAFHWGAEYQDQPDERQKYLGHLAIDSGADLVIGNHPHRIQPVEIYKDKLITYAHGNFIFDQEWSRETREGVVGKYTFYDKKLIDVEYFPVKIENYGQPYFLSGNEKNRILENMKLQSEILAKD